MTFWKPGSVSQALGVPLDVAGRAFSTIQTDTRSISRGSLFVALEGDRFDGHDFLESARDGGASAAVVRRGTEAVAGLDLIEVDDTLIAYGQLARFRRRSIDGPVVGVTGTNGKTSTKELIRTVLQTKWKTYATRVNNNNRVGVPLTILEAPEDSEALVIEAGANLPGEIAHLRDIIEPTIGVITNVAAGHLSGFGTLDGVMQEKLSLLRNVPHAVVGDQPDSLSDLARTLAPSVTVAGLSPNRDVHPDSWTLDGRGCGRLRFGDTAVQLAIPGVHQVANATIAFGVARVAGLDETSASAMEEVSLPRGRCEVFQSGNLTILDDTYNANPASLDAALRLADSLRGGRRTVIVLGTMLELGDQSDEQHRLAAEHVLAFRPDLVGAVGDFVPAFQRLTEDGSDQLIVRDDVEDLGRALRARLAGDELVLLKASRGVGLERAIPHITQS